MLALLALRGCRVRCRRWEPDLAVARLPPAPRREALEVRLDRLLEDPGNAPCPRAVGYSRYRSRSDETHIGGRRKNVSNAQCEKRAAACRRAIDRLHQSEVKVHAVDRAAPNLQLPARWDHAQDQAVPVVVLVRAVGLATMANGLDTGCGQGTSLVHQIALHVVSHKECEPRVLRKTVGGLSGS